MQDNHVSAGTPPWTLLGSIQRSTVRVRHFLIFYNLKIPEPIFIIFGKQYLDNTQSIYNFTSNPIYLLYFAILPGTGNDVFSHVTAVCKHAIK